MRLTFFLVLAITLQVGARSMAQEKVSMFVKDEQLSKVLDLAEKQTGYVFFFDEKLLTLAKPVTINVKDLPLKQFLEKVFQHQPLKYNLRNKTITLSLKEGNAQPLATETENESATAVVVKGMITDTDGKPLAGVTVKLKPTAMGTTTDDKGAFFFLSIEPGNYTLEFSSIGYVSLSKKIVVTSKPQEFEFLMQRDVLEQKEIIITTGYTQRKTGEITGAVQKISGDEIRRGITSSDPAALLKGRVAGLYISEQNGADPTSSGGQIFMRGQSSIAGVGVDQSNEFAVPALNYGPLIVLDGVIMPNQNLRELVTPQEIQEITVLKDAAATAIYGSRAAAGVLVVTTIKGRNVKPRITADIKYGANIPNRGAMQFMNAAELYDLQKRFYTEDYKVNGASLSALYPTVDDYLNYRLPSQADIANQYDWTKYAFVTSSLKEANISASGGNDRTRYYFGGTYYNEQATGVSNSLVRKSFRLNLDSRLTDRLTATVMINAILNNGRRDPAGTADLFPQLIPWANPYNSTGALSQALNYKMGGTQQVKDNPIFSRPYNYTTQNSQLFSGSFKLDYRITDWLSISTTNSGNLNYNKGETYIDVRTYDGGASIFAPQGFLGTNTTNLANYLTSNQLNFNKTFGAHNFRALAAMEFGQTTVENTLVNVNHVKAGYPVISLGRQVGDRLDLSIFGIPSLKAGNIEGGKDVKAIYSAFGEIGYTYKARLSITGSVRTDASSSFGPENRYGTFYSGGAAWTISDEAFLRDVKWINNIKIRANYGTSGSQLGDNFLTTTLYDPRGSYSNQGTAIIAVLGNPQLRWEITRALGAGVDFALFKDRISGMLDIYQRRSSDLLQKVNLSAISGFPSQWQNAASVQNRGIEVMLNTKNIEQKDFSWTTNLNFSYNRNRILAVANDSLRQGYTDDNAYFLYRGDDINALKAVKYAGVDPETGKPRFEKLIFDSKGNRTGVEYVNTVAEAGAASDNRQLQTIGTFQPRYYGGINNTFTYKNFALSVLITYALDYVVMDGYANSYQVANISLFNQLKYRSSQKPWTTPGQTDATEPALYYQATTNYRGSSRYIRNASNMALRNVRLSYDIPKSFTNKLKMASCSIYASGDNLATVYNKYLVASSPEGPSVGDAQNFGGSAGTLSIPRRYVFGLQASF